MITFENLDPNHEKLSCDDSLDKRIDLELRHSVELSGIEIDLLANLLSGRIAYEFYQTRGVSNEHIESLCNLRKRLGEFINIEYV